MNEPFKIPDASRSVITVEDKAPSKAWWEKPAGLLVLSVLGTVVAAGVIYFIGWN